MATTTEPTRTYGVRLRIRPDTSGANSASTATVLYRATSSGGTYAEVARVNGAAEWVYDDTLPLGSGKKYYKIRSEALRMTESAWVGPVDAEPIDLDTAI